MPARIDQLARIHQSSIIMLDCARDLRWHELPALEADRAQLLKDLAAMPVARDTRDSAIDAEADILRRILETNTALIELGERHRKQLAGELTGARQKRYAAKVYSMSATLPHSMP